MAKIYVLCGMIAAGKSTYCKHAAKHGLITVNDDAIINMLHGDDYTLYDKDLKFIYKSIENQIVISSLALKRSVIIDRGLSVSLKARRRWLALADSFDVKCEAIVFPKQPYEVHAQRRASADVRGHDLNYWLNAARCHEADYVEPTLKEGFNAIHYLTFAEIQAGKVV